MNLRQRGGSVADLAILVIDIIEGFEEITYESLRILKERKVPFVVAANKIDKIPGWRTVQNAPFVVSLKMQSPTALKTMDDLIYKIVEKFSYEGFDADRYDRVKDFTKTLAIVPTSAVSGEGIPDLLLVLAGLSQKYMMKRLYVGTEPAKGTVLESREVTGLGTVVDAIVYDGVLRRGQFVVMGGMEKPIATRIRVLLLPKPLDEMRDPEDRFKPVDEVIAAAGVRIVAPSLEGVLTGSPLFATDNETELEELKQRVKEELAGIRISTQANGVVVKADTLGSLEALTLKLKQLNIPVRMADIGVISKRDVMEAAIVKSVDPYLGVILAFNVKSLQEAEDEARSRGIKVFQSNVIYRLIEDYQSWVASMKEVDRRRELESLVKPGLIRIIPGYVFRRSNPAIVGVEVQQGQIKPGYCLMRDDGKEVGTILQIQDKGKTLNIAMPGQAVAISIKGDIIVGRHIKEGDLLYVNVPEEAIKAFKTKYLDALNDEERKLLEKITTIKRGALKR